MLFPFEGQPVVEGLVFTTFHFSATGTLGQALSCTYYHGTAAQGNQRNPQRPSPVCQRLGLLPTAVGGAERGVAVQYSRTGTSSLVLLAVQYYSTSRYW
jgi:hypothetical protein